jgi:putative ABC transport system ATP-binding protein
MAHASPLVRLEDVSKTYREGDGDTVVLTAANLKLERGETTSIVGASGSGKSTLLGLIAGTMRPESGSIVFDGHDIVALDDTARARLRARRIGIVLQSGNLVPFLTAMENVELAVKLAGGRRAEQRARDLLSELGLARRLHHLPRRLSGGEAQRVSVAVALANSPDLLLADEVTAELDAASADQVIDVIAKAWRERALTVLLATHDSQLAAEAGRRLRLANGALCPA